MRKIALLLLLAPALLNAQTVSAPGKVSGTGTISIVPPPPPPPPPSGGIPQTIGWFQIPNTNYSTICPPRPPTGNEDCSGVMSDWAGGAGDPIGNRLIFTGGGHHGYYGNELYSLNLNTLTISLLDKQSDASGIDSNTAVTVDPMADGTPGARHTYGGISYDPTAQKLRMFGGSPPSPGVLVNNTWEVLPSCLNPASTGAGCWKQGVTGTPGANQFQITFAGGSLSNSQFGDLLEWGGGNDDFMYLAEPFGASVGHLWRFNHTTNTYTQLSTLQSTPNMDGTQSAAIDTTNHVMYAAGNGKFLKMSLVSGFQWSNVTGTGCNTGAAPLSNAYPGVAYDSGDGKIVVWSDGNSVLAYDPTANSCAIETYASGPPSIVGNVNCNDAPLACNGVFGRFRYFPALGVFATCPGPGLNCFTLRRHALTNGFVARAAGVNIPGGSASVISSLSLYTLPPTTIQVYQASTFGNGSITNDTTNHTFDGAGSLHWHMNAGAFQGEPGTWNYNFSPGNNVYTGQGQEFYFSIRMRYDAAMIDPNEISNFEGSKMFFISEGDSPTSGQTGGCSNTPTDTVVQNGTSRIGYLNNYWNCGVAGTLNFLNTGFQPVQLFGPSLPGPSGNFLDQVTMPCPHYTGFAGLPASGCFNFVANEWFTVQLHVKWGGNNTPDSIEDLWASHEGQPSVLVNNAADMAIRDLGGSITDKFGKATLGPYATGGTFVNPANVWYCCIEVATRRIPDPEVAVPNAPDSLTLTAISTSSITVNWRVNSNNNTPQDDTGFVIERCTNTTPQCMGEQSPWVQVGTTAAHAALFVDNTVSTGHTYVYRVHAVNQFGRSADAKSVCFNGSTTCGGTAAI